MLKAAGDGGREEGRQGERNEEDTSISTDIQIILLYALYPSGALYQS